MKKIIDMAGRVLELPDKINRIYGPSPYASTLLNSLCPELVCGNFFPVEEWQKPYLPKCLHNLPVIGKVSETENIIKANPDLIVIWGEKSSPVHSKSELALANTGIPYAYVCAGELVDLRDYPSLYRFLGSILGIEARAESLAKYCEETLSEVYETVNCVHPQQRPRVYYAEGYKGMETEFSHSLHAHLLELIGDVNVHRGNLVGHPGMEKLTKEEILKYDPEVIIVWREEAFTEISDPDSFWAETKAVKNNRFYMIPKEPYSYFDRPPCFMRILGLKWLLSICYPDYYKKDFESEKARFLKLFLPD